MIDIPGPAGFPGSSAGLEYRLVVQQLTQLAKLSYDLTIISDFYGKLSCAYVAAGSYDHFCYYHTFPFRRTVNNPVTPIATFLT
ncbi:hypothetical protein ES703_111006 [subsurface metagenome]